MGRFLDDGLMGVIIEKKKGGDGLDAVSLYPQYIIFRLPGCRYIVGSTGFYDVLTGAS